MSALPIPIEIPKFPDIENIVPPDETVPTIPALTTAYATLIQDYIDGRIADWSQYYTPVAVLLAEMQLIRNAVCRKYHTARGELLRTEGNKNAQSMPGHVMRKLTNLGLEERRDISEAQAKAITERCSQSLDNISWAIDAGFKSAALRDKTKFSLAELDLKIIDAALKGAMEAVKQNVERANKIIEYAALQTREGIVRTRISDLGYEESIAEYRAKRIDLEVEGYAIEGSAVGADLEAQAKRLEALEAEMLVAMAEIGKALVMKQMAQAELLVLNAKLITMAYEIEKSQARLQAALVEAEKIAVRVAMENAEMARDNARDQAERAELKLSIAEKNLGLAQDQYELAKKQFDVEQTNARTKLTAMRAQTLTTRGNIIANVASMKINNMLNLAYNEADEKRRLASTLKAEDSDRRIQALDQYSQLLESATNNNVDAIISAAQDAANKTVESTHIYRSK